MIWNTPKYGEKINHSYHHGNTFLPKTDRVTFNLLNPPTLPSLTKQLHVCTSLINLISKSSLFKLLLLLLLLLLLQVIPVKVNYNYFTLYKASSLTLKLDKYNNLIKKG